MADPRRTRLPLVLAAAAWLPAAALLAGLLIASPGVAQETPEAAPDATAPDATAPDATGAETPEATTPPDTTASEVPDATADATAAPAAAEASQQVAPDAVTGGPAGDVAITQIEGFRSARFGMTEDEVLAAIEQDFGIPAAQVTREPNVLEKTTALVATVDELIPDGGPARVAYILGFRSKALIQVNVIWGAPSGGAASAEDLVTTARILLSYFGQRSYAPGTVFSNVPLSDDTVVLFTGGDAEGRQATLTMSRVAAAPAAEQGDAPAETAGAAGEQAGSEQDGGGEAGAAASGVDTVLRLSYVENANEPDVFRLQPGDF